MTQIAETLRGGLASARFLAGAPITMARIAGGAAVGRDARAPLEDLFARFFLACRLDVGVDGDPPPPGTGCVLSHNESAFPDIAAYFQTIWPHVDRLAGADLYRHIPFARRACEKLDIELVARGKRQLTDAVVDRMVVAAQSGLRVGWGGEGRLTGIDGVGRFKVGGSLIAIRAKVPIVPVVIHGGHRAMRLGTVRARPGQIRVRFCAPVPTAHLVEADARALADQVERIVAETYATMAPARVRTH